MKRWLLLSISAALTTACGGGGSSGAAPPPLPRQTIVRVALHLSVPAVSRTSTTKLRHVLTVAQNTAGLQVNVVAHGTTSPVLATTTADISPTTGISSGNCTATTNGGRTCNIPLNAPAGNDDFIITTYDLPPAPGGGGIPASAHELAYAISNVTVTAGAPATVNATLGGVLSSVSVGLTPAFLHTLVPSTMTLNVYALDADDDVIVGPYIDANGNPVNVNLSASPTTSALSLASSSISSTPVGGVQVSYAPSGIVAAPVPISITASGTGITGGSAQLSEVAPVFASIADSDLGALNPHHGSMIVDSAAGVYYSTPLGNGGTAGTGAISYYSPALGYGSYYDAAGNLIRSVGADFYMLDGVTEYVIPQPVALPLTPTTGGGTVNANAAPLPNGSGMGLDAGFNLWYTSGANLVEYNVLPSGAAATTFGLGATVNAGLALDAGGNVWVIDNVNNKIIKHTTLGNSTFSAGVAPFDVVTNGSSVFVTDANSAAPQIVQLSDSNGSLVRNIALPAGTLPYYIGADYAQAGILWFDYLTGSTIGVGRIDTNVTPPAVTMATYNAAAAPLGSQPGAIAVASDGSIYMVFENTSTLVQVQR